MAAKQQELSTLPCPICGGTSYSWGEVVAQSLGYLAGKPGLLDKMKAASGVSLPARQCDNCENVQLFGSVVDD